MSMKNSVVAEFGSVVRAIAIVPSTLWRPVFEVGSSWIGTIAPEGVLAYKEEESRGVWQLGNAVFMRNWPYAYALGNSGDSAIKGQFDVAPLPKGEAQAGRGES